MSICSRNFYKLWAGLLLTLLNVACLGDEPYRETFGSRENNTWLIDGQTEMFGNIVNGVYQFTVKEPNVMYWTTPGQRFGDGTYEVEARQTGGSIASGYGLLIRVNGSTHSFYRLGVNSQGNVTMDRCEQGCEVYDTLVGVPWMFSPAVKREIREWNHLKIVIIDDTLTFYVNNEQVGAAADEDVLGSGDIGLFVETGEEGNVTVWFDNVKFTPPED